MIGEILAYYIGRSAGRSDPRVRVTQERSVRVKATLALGALFFGGLLLLILVAG